MCSRILSGLTMRAFRGEHLIGFSINSVHHVDIGGRKGSGLSEEVYEEGLIIMMARLLIQQVLTRIEEFALMEVMSGSAG